MWGASTVKKARPPKLFLSSSENIPAFLSSYVKLAVADADAEWTYAQSKMFSCLRSVFWTARPATWPS